MENKRPSDSHPVTIESDPITDLLPDDGELAPGENPINEEIIVHHEAMAEKPEPEADEEIEDIKEIYTEASIDNRLAWLRDKIGSSLGVTEREFTNLMILENFPQFKQFMEDEQMEVKDIDKRIVFVYRTFYDKLVESTITVLELVEKPPPQESTDTGKDKKKKKGKSGKGTKDFTDGEVKPDQDLVRDSAESPRLGNVFSQ